MQTFLPYEDFQASAEVLDWRRLGNQRVEVLQILKALRGDSKGWVNHPATKMWRNHELALCHYGIVMCSEWIGRGYKDTCTQKIKEIQVGYEKNSSYELPPWVGSEQFHISHRSNLIRKAPEHYQKFWPTLPGDIPYVWPSS